MQRRRLLPHRCWYYAGTNLASVYQPAGNLHPQRRRSAGQQRPAPVYPFFRPQRHARQQKVLVTSNTPTFTFNPATMQTGVTYYVAAIAGNNVGGNVDLNDPCLDVSNAAQLIWRPLPTVAFSVANPDVCAGACTTVMATFTGSAPFTLTYTTPGGGPVTQTFSSNMGTFQVCAPAGAPVGGFSVQATALVDEWCTCQ